MRAPLNPRPRSMMATALLALSVGALPAGCSDDSSEDAADASPFGGGGGSFGGFGGGAGGAGGEPVGGTPMGGAGGEPMGGTPMGGAPMGGAGGGGGLPPAPMATELPPPEGIAAPPAEVIARPPACGDGFEWVTEVRGWLVDDQGQPVSGAKAQACINIAPDGMLLCLQPADTAGDGSFSISVNAEARCMEKVSMRALLPGSAMATSYAIGSFDTVSDAVMRLTDPVVLYTTVPAEAPPEGDELAPRAVAFYDGLEITDLVPDRYFGSYDRIAARRIDPEGAPGLYFLEGQPAPRAVWAFLPEGDIEGAAFTLRIPNDGGLAPGAAVDLYALGGLNCTLTDGTHVPEGEWVQYGEGYVDDEGAYIVSGPDQGGLPCVNWMGYSAR